MKITTTLLLLVFSASLLAQTVPTVPRNIGFAGMNLQLDEDARAVIQADVKALLANRKYWEAKLDRCLMYFPIIEGVLIDNEVPTDFKYLAVQESSLQPDAVSASNAVGFWQFKKETATDYGMRVDDQIDERKNITSSTRAAANYLKKSNAQFNNWIASLYSFYLGAGGISKTIPSDWSYSREITLNGKSDRYILRFLAHKVAIESAIDRYQSPSPVLLMEYPKAGGRTLDGLSKELDVDQVALRTYNRWLMTTDVPGDKEYSMVVPVTADRMNDVRAAIAKTKSPGPRDNFVQNDIGFPLLNRAASPVGSSIELYEINGLPGIMAGGNDNSASLAKKAKVSFGSFLRYNDMSENDALTPGDVYYLAKKFKKAAIPYHTVREGESLWKISQIYALRLKKLVKYNRIDNRAQRLQTGRILWLAEKRPRNKPVEIVNQPQEEEWRPAPPVSSKSQPRPSAEEVSNGNSTANNSKIPQKASERKKYTPKMADTPAAPANTGDELGVEITDSAPPRPKTESKPSTPSTTKPTRRAPSFNPSDDDKIVVVTGDDEPEKPTAKPESVKTKQPQKATTSPAPSVATSAPKVVETEAKKPEPKASTPASVATPAKVVSTASQSTKDGKSFYHTVEPGQTFFSISKMYDVSVNDLLFWNSLPQDATLKSGQKLMIKPVGNTLQQQPQDKADAFVTHTVELGETMFRVAQKYGVKVDQIKEWNNLPDYGVKAGQQLKIKKN
jgi:membrane-bound lytic murein transglycosylase D